MSIPATYRRFISQLTGGLSWAQKRLGQRYFGTIGLLADLTAEGARQALLAHLPGNPQQAEDSLNQSGADAGMFRYRGESLASWRARVSDPWPVHEQAGTVPNLLREIDIWGQIVYPGTWVSGQCYVLEPKWARFALIIPAGLLPWTGPPLYGGGSTYGDGSHYGVTANSEDLATLRRIVRKWKPSRSKASAVAILSGHIYGQRGLTYGDGSTYGSVALRVNF